MPDASRRVDGPARDDEGDAACITTPHPGLVPDAEADHAALTRAAYMFFQMFFSGKATNPSSAVLLALSESVLAVKKRFAVRAALLPTEEHARERPASHSPDETTTSGGTDATHPGGVPVGDLTREEVVRKLVTILAAENGHHRTPHTLDTIDDCLAALHLLCKVFARRSTARQRPLDPTEWTDLDRLLGYTLVLIAAHDPARAGHPPPARDNALSGAEPAAQQGAIPGPGTAADPATTEESDES